VLPDATYLRLGMSFPFPETLVRAFCDRFERVYVIEEGEPFIEEQLRIRGITNIVGKEKVPLMGELNPEILAQAIQGTPIPESHGDEIPLPPRPPLFCLGCPHRGVFYVLKKMMKSDVVALGDIGCYTLGGLPPYSSMQTSFCMGGSVGNAVGFALGNQGNGGHKAVGVIGDGTFLHGGIPGLIDMVYKRSPATLVICDNSTTAMTGQQENPASGHTSSGQEAPEVDLVKQHGCLRIKEERKKHREPIRFEAENCDKCKLCHDLGCPAMEWSDETGPIIDDLQCVGCAMCAELCVADALGPGEVAP
jgi:indolepyruvate ferredoxin oxidoreductase alpha subunit